MSGARPHQLELNRPSLLTQCVRATPASGQMTAQIVLHGVLGDLNDVDRLVALLIAGVWRVAGQTPELTVERQRDGSTVTASSAAVRVVLRTYVADQQALLDITVVDGSIEPHAVAVGLVAELQPNAVSPADRKTGSVEHFVPRCRACDREELNAESVVSSAVSSAVSLDAAAAARALRPGADRPRVTAARCAGDEPCSRSADVSARPAPTVAVELTDELQARPCDRRRRRPAGWC
jgi:hypothetical protein